MDSNTSPPAPDFFSSDLTAVSSPCKPVLRLGEKIARELGLDDRADTLSLWMAHYVAELIQQAEAAAPEERTAAQTRCADAILEIWKHRRYFPPGMRPLEDFAPILKAMESLDPD